jgi:8-oxo-dGTP pyrophosphatase MutT (NUDIX family)
MRERQKTAVLKLMTPEQKQKIGQLLRRLAHAAPTETGLPARELQYATLYTPEDGYAAALIDMLCWFGVLRRHEQQPAVSVTSIQAGYVLQMLEALLHIDAPPVIDPMIDWTREGIQPAADDAPLSAVQLLAYLDAYRRRHVPDAKPLRTVQAAVTLIMARDTAGNRLYLMFWDTAAQSWQLIGGRYEERDHTIRQTMLRELQEELQVDTLADGEDVVLHALGDPFTLERMSPTFGLYTRTIFYPYIAYFPSGIPELHQQLRWVSESELIRGVTQNGESVTASVFHHLRNTQRLADLPMSDAPVIRQRTY